MERLQPLVLSTEQQQKVGHSSDAFPFESNTSNLQVLQVAKVRLAFADPRRVRRGDEAGAGGEPRGAEGLVAPHGEHLHPRAAGRIRYERLEGFTQ